MSVHVLQNTPIYFGHSLFMLKCERSCIFLQCPFSQTRNYPSPGAREHAVPLQKTYEGGGSGQDPSLPDTGSSGGAGDWWPAATGV